MAKRKRRTFTAEFKSTVAAEVSAGKSTEEVAKLYKLHPSVVRSWVASAPETPALDPASTGALTAAERAELAHLRVRVKELEGERVTLTRAAALFAREVPQGREVH